MQGAECFFTQCDMEEREEKESRRLGVKRLYANNVRSEHRL